MTALAIIGAVTVAAFLVAGIVLAAWGLYRARGQALSAAEARLIRSVLDDGGGPPLRVVRGGKERR